MILTQGGNAVDSAITTALCQGIMSPAASGLGGGNFMIIRSPNGTTEVIDAREVAPAAATENMFKGLLTGSLTAQPRCKQAYVRIHSGAGLPLRRGEWGRGGGGEASAAKAKSKVLRHQGFTKARFACTDLTSSL